MNAVIYCRVATTNQAQYGYSLTAQEKICREYAERNGYKVSKTFIDSGSSALDMDRGGLKDLLIYALKNKKRLSALIVSDGDRLARNLCDAVELQGCFDSLNIKVLSATQNNNAASRLRMNISNCFAQYESDVKSERIKEGLRKCKRAKTK